jgi:gas vesicle structural protein
MVERNRRTRPPSLAKPPPAPSRTAEALQMDDLVLSELVSRVLDRGVMVAGDVTISVAGIDLVHLALRIRLSSTETLHRDALDRGRARGADAPPEGSG